MVRRDHHAYHDFAQWKADQKAEESKYEHPSSPFEDYAPVELPEQLSINKRLAATKITPSGSKLVDQIPGPQLPSTLGISSTSREPVPEIPEEREIAQATVDTANEGQFRTFQDTCPPPADSQYTVIDQGVSGPNFLRTSMYNVPASEKVRKLTQLPLSLYLRPFAEADVPLADFSRFNGEEVPPRCRRCRAYMNPSMRFVNGGSKFVCNLCLFVNETPPEYYQPTGPDGRRLDWDQRPELAFGTYDLMVVPAAKKKGKKSSKSATNGRATTITDRSTSETNRGHGLGPGQTPHPQTVTPPAMHANSDSSDESDDEELEDEKHNHGVELDGFEEYINQKKNDYSVYGEPASREFRRVFVCESSRDPSQKNLISVFAESIVASLPYMGQNERIAIMTFDSHINYFRIDENHKIQMLVSSPHSPVVPPDVFINPHKQRDALLKLLDNLPTFFENTVDRGSCLGNALETVLDLPLCNDGGRVTALFTSLPSVGSSQLTMRDTAIAGITPPESPVHKDLFEPTSRYYKELSSKLKESGWGVDVLAVPTTGYLDMANLIVVPQQTGGKVFYYPRYVYERDARRIIGDMLSIVSAPMQARNASLRLRVSNGLQVEKIYGSGSHGNSFMDSDSTLVATITFDGQLDPKLDAHFQAAILYTASSGEKRVRVCNLLTGVTMKLKAVLKFVDTDVIMATITRQTLAQMNTHTLSDLRQAVLAKIESVFGAARKHAGQGMPHSQLLMPTNMRQLLMYGLALTKSIAIGSRAFSCDARVISAHYLSNSTVNQLSLALYPRIHDIGKTVLGQAGKPSNDGAEGAEEVANAINNSRSSMTRARFADLMLGTHAFLVFDGQQIYVWLSELVDSSVLNALFGVEAIDDVSPWLDELPEIDSHASHRARDLCASLALRVDRSWLPIQIVRQRLDGAEYQLRQLMSEDTIGNSPSYINYIVRVHQKAKEYNDKEGWF